nr:protein ANTI-SILENCING 1 isoform X3 [Ipomoea trifida]
MLGLQTLLQSLGNGESIIKTQPLVADIVALPKSQRSGAPSFAGHIFIDRVRHQMQREMREAVSTSHCSQPNTIEYEMAMEWRLLQSRSDFWWKMLFEYYGGKRYKRDKDSDGGGLGTGGGGGGYVHPTLAGVAVPVAGAVKGD